MTSSSASAQDIDHVAAELVACLPALCRALDRRVDREFPHPKPPEAQLALLRLVHTQDGVTVREAADALLMRPNNVSALVTQMVGLGLLERRPDPADKRIAHLHPTALARQRVTEVDRLMSAHLTEVLRALTDGELDALGSAVGSLHSVNRLLHARTD
ncbi:MarR family winged helix-turn-helix transcriptional regulator [Streptomyces sp. DH24]|uniref:MarR family winged helix-turn-helix transcriptional regulator n=1 Tax=Streptomyces sp. DH24 TaxID=3040123 RepID=UPI002441E28D|nr:MarR family transcriptional regulator [Streptomyces sp. DH24]MDG9715546.1 MarR family transcriptional regulator [Streptomyces sp. DH24]